MADITKIRALHDVKQYFEVDDDHVESLAAQLSEEDQSSIDRFFRGFEIEDWFEAIFGIMPWSHLLHGLSQRQVPSRSKETLQVPDFTAFIETSTFRSEPLLIETKRVTGNKQTLKLRKTQVEPTLTYTNTLGIPLVYATYWDLCGAWTLNTLDSFESNSSTYKIALATAFEFDCSLIFGDVFYLITQQIHRVRTFSTEPIDSPPVVHETFGGLLSDEVTIDDKTHSLSGVEPAVLDSMFAFAETDVSHDQHRTTITSETREIFCFKFSAWITRYLSLYRIAPDEPHANAAGHVILELMKKLDIPRVKMYPTGRTPELIHLDSRYLHPEELK